MDNVEENKYSFGGGISEDSRISADTVKFSGWQETALATELPIKFYTTLEQMGLSDADMAEDDFVGNLDKINWAVGYQACLVQLTVTTDTYANFSRSILNQLKKDGLDYVNAQGWANVFKMERDNNPWDAIKMEIILDVFGFDCRSKTIIAYANRDGDWFTVYPFREVAKIEYPSNEIELLNGWTKTEFSLVKIGNCVIFSLEASDGIRERGTAVFALPKGFIPSKNKFFSVMHNGSKNLGRLVAQRNGYVTKYDLEDSTGVFVCTGVFSID